MKHKAELITGPVGRTLFRMTGPMVMGFLAMVIFNFVDTYWVSRLGVDQTAVMQIIMPVQLIIVAVGIGMGVGTSSVISRMLGRGDGHQVQQQVTHAIALAVLVVLVVATVGVLTIDVLFPHIGAGPKTMPYVRQYMTIWYIGIVFVIVPMVGNNAMRAGGDTMTPGLIMMAGAVVNMVLDPLLIFGWWIFPRMEMQGAALATVIARAITMLLSLVVLHHRKRMLAWVVPRMHELIRSWGRILHIGLPESLSNLFLPASIAVVNIMIKWHGTEAMAGVAIGNRVRMLAVMPMMAVGHVLVPLVGQNFAAGKVDRVDEARRVAFRFALLWGLGMWALLAAGAPVVGWIFKNEKNVDAMPYLYRYLWIIPLGFAPQAITRMSGAMFNAVGHPMKAASLNLLRLFALYVPMAFLGERLFGFMGILAGMATANWIAGTVAYTWVRLFEANQLRRRKLTPPADTG